jgi:hypothetical protein
VLGMSISRRRLPGWQPSSLYSTARLTISVHMEKEVSWGG